MQPFHYKTVLIDFDGTLLDTSIMPQYSAKVRQYKRYSPEWHQAIIEDNAKYELDRSKYDVYGNPYPDPKEIEESFNDYHF